MLVKIVTVLRFPIRPRIQRLLMCDFFLRKGSGSLLRVRGAMSPRLHRSSSWSLLRRVSVRDLGQDRNPYQGILWVCLGVHMRKSVAFVVDRETDGVDEMSRHASFNPSDNYAQRGRQVCKESRGGGGRQRGSDTSPQMTPQERRQYEWYVKKFEKADTAVDPNAERERISMIMAALFPHHSHMPPERNERKVGKKKGPQGETPGESRDEIKARTAAQKLEQQSMRAKAQQRALLHAAALPNVHHVSTRQKAQSAPVEKRARTPSPSDSTSSKKSSSSTSSPSKDKEEIQEISGSPDVDLSLPEPVRSEGSSSLSAAQNCDSQQREGTVL